jgi:hypothetical protein
MASVFDKNYLCSNQKRCFLILLLFNLFVVCLYYSYGSISQNAIRFTTPIDTYAYHKHVSPIKYIQSVLNNEYDHDDLVTFYNLAKKEFSLGLRCTRKASPTTTVPITSNITTDQQTNSNISTNR